LPISSLFAAPVVAAAGAEEDEEEAEDCAEAADPVGELEADEALDAVDEDADPVAAAVDAVLLVFDAAAVEAQVAD
jgi:hypothetical protein